VERLVQREIRDWKNPLVWTEVKLTPTRRKEKPMSLCFKPTLGTSRDNPSGPVRAAARSLEAGLKD